MVFTAELLINGESVDGAGESLAVQNPSTGSTICEIVKAKRYRTFESNIFLQIIPDHVKISSLM